MDTMIGYPSPQSNWNAHLRPMDYTCECGHTLGSHDLALDVCDVRQCDCIHFKEFRYEDVS